MKGVIFDLDGTLIDSMYIWESIAYDYLSPMGYDVPKDIYLELRNMSLRESVEYLKEKYNVDKSSAKMESDMKQILYYSYENVFDLRIGVKDLLDNLKSKGVDICIATVTDEKLVWPVLKRLKIDDYFEFVQTEKNSNISKTEPRFYDLALERLGKAKEDVWVFEDALYAIKSAKSAGFKVLAIRDESNKDQLDEIKEVSDIYVEDFNNLEVDLLWKNY